MQVCMRAPVRLSTLRQARTTRAHTHARTLRNRMRLQEREAEPVRELWIKCAGAPPNRRTTIQHA